MLRCCTSESEGIDKDNNPHNPDIELRGNPDNKGHRPLYISTAMEQSRLNAIAATHTGIVAALQVVTLIVDFFPPV